MHILILNWKDIKNPEVGGAEIILYELAKRLVRDGHRVEWFSREFAGGRQNEIIDGIQIIRKGNRITVYIHAWNYYRSLKQKPDKVIDSINTICWQTPLYVDSPRRIAYANQLAKEVFFYELPSPFSHLCFLGENLEYKTYKTTKFICYSRSVRDDLATFGIPKNNISIFPLGVDHNRYMPGKKSDIPLFVFVARLVKMKRVDLCIKAMHEVVKRYKNAKLAIVGYGPEEKNIRNLIQKLDLCGNVSIANKDNLFLERDRKDIKVKLLKEAWVLLLPSVKEGWGMVVTEAAACGTPAIVSRVSGLCDSVLDQTTGFILSANPTADELAEAMLTLIEDEKLRRQLNTNAIVWAKKFSWETSYKKFLELIK